MVEVAEDAEAGWLETADWLFLFYDQYRPRFFVNLGDIDIRCHAFRVFKLAASQWQDYDFLHERLHVHLENVCRGLPNKKWRRNGRDSAFSQLVRDGPPGGHGCKDTPAQDVDWAFLVPKDGRFVLTGLREIKHTGERYDDSQRKVLENVRESSELEVETLVVPPGGGLCCVCGLPAARDERELDGKFLHVPCGRAFWR